MTEHDLIYGETILSKDSFKTLEKTVKFYKKELKRFGKKLNKAIDKMEGKKEKYEN